MHPLDHFLALDTATENCSVALRVGAQIFTRECVAPQRHAELLLTQIEEVLAEGGVTREQLRGIAAGQGPGSFTGVRVALSAAQALGMALGLKIALMNDVHMLACAAAHKCPDFDWALGIIDARMGEVYYALYAVGADGLKECLKPAVASPEQAVAAITGVCGADAGIAAAGTGTPLVSAGLKNLCDSGVQFPQACTILEGDNALGVSLCTPAEALPLYVRDQVVKPVTA